MKQLICVLLFIGLSMGKAAAQQVIPPLKKQFLDSAWHVLPSAAGARYRRETEWRDSTAGTIRDYFLSGQLQSKEEFDNIRTRHFNGVSKYYYENGQLKKQREFSHGERTGELYRYYASGQLMSHEHFANDKRVKDGECFKEDGTPEPFYIFATLPKYSEGDGSQRAVVEALVRKFIYPKDAARAGVQGRLLLSFEVTEKGSIEQIKVVDGLSSSINAEAIRAIKQLSKFSPALEDGKPIRLRYMVPFTLTLQQ